MCLSNCEFKCHQTEILRVGMSKGKQMGKYSEKTWIGSKIKFKYIIINFE